MMEIKPAPHQRTLFARKGEAMPTSSVEAGLKPNLPGNHFAEADSAVDGDGPGNNGDGVNAATLSFLIARRNPRTAVIAPESFHHIAPAKESRTLEAPEKADITAAETRRRHSFTVRLEPNDRRALMTLAIRSDRTYQAIIESAIRNYLKETDNQAGEKAENEPPQLEPATATRVLSKLISRA